jgi:hypothetical protein
MQGFKITVFLSKLPWRRRQRLPSKHRCTQTNIHTRTHIPEYCNVTAVHGITHQSTQSDGCVRHSVYTFASRTSECDDVGSSYLQWRQFWQLAECSHCHLPNYVAVQTAAKEKILYYNQMITFIRTYTVCKKRQDTTLKLRKLTVFRWSEVTLNRLLETSATDEPFPRLLSFALKGKSQLRILGNKKRAVAKSRDEVEVLWQ